MPQEAPTIPEPPADWIGSRPEFAIWWALLRLGMKDRFSYQTARMGGRLTKGGAVLDFFIPEFNLAINVQSTYWHYATTSQRMAGELQRAQLEGMGINIIYIDEEDALRDPLYYVKEALEGRDHSRMAR
jgi:hypothetical protein